MDRTVSTESAHIFDWLNPITTLFAAFLGAGSAFLLEYFRRNREEEKRQLSASKRAIYVLSEMLSVVAQYRKEVVLPYDEKPDAWLNMNVSYVSVWAVSDLNDDAISFLLDTSEANCFAELILEQRRFRSLRNLVKRREKILLESVFPALGKIIPVGGQVDSNKFTELLGHHTENELKFLTAGIVEQSASLSKTLVETHDKLRDAIAKIHPEKMSFKFVPFESPN